MHITYVVARPSSGGVAMHAYVMYFRFCGWRHVCTQWPRMSVERRKKAYTRRLARWQHGHDTAAYTETSEQHRTVGDRLFDYEFCYLSDRLQSSTAMPGCYPLQSRTWLCVWIQSSTPHVTRSSDALSSRCSTSPLLRLAINTGNTRWLMNASAFHPIGRHRHLKYGKSIFRVRGRYASATNNPNSNTNHNLNHNSNHRPHFRTDNALFATGNQHKQMFKDVGVISCVFNADNGRYAVRPMC